MTGSAEPILVVVGATGGGKSNFAVKLSKHFGAEVVTLDSVQIYKDLNVGSGKITNDEMLGVPHHLLDEYSPNAQVNVAEVVSLADAAINKIRAKAKLPIIVAGTSLYLKCLLHGLVDSPGEDSSFRDSVADSTTEELHRRLVIVDPTRAAELNKNDRVRIIRSLEIEQLCGRPHSEIVNNHQHKEVRYPALIVNLCWTREKLYRRIDSRCETMLARGLIQETRTVIDSFGVSSPPLRTLGYKQAVDFLEGRISMDDVLVEMSTKTRQFAKRQLTFLRNAGDALGWFISPVSGQGVELKSNPSSVKKGQIIADFTVFNYEYSEVLTHISNHLNDKKPGVYLWNISAESVI